MLGPVGQGGFPQRMSDGHHLQDIGEECALKAQKLCEVRHLLRQVAPASSTGKGSNDAVLCRALGGRQELFQAEPLAQHLTPSKDSTVITMVTTLGTGSPVVGWNEQAAYSVCLRGSQACKCSTLRPCIVACFLRFFFYF